VIESRREGLERFLQIVAGHPLLQAGFSAILGAQSDAFPDGQQSALRILARPVGPFSQGPWSSSSAPADPGTSTTMRDAPAGPESTFQVRSDPRYSATVLTTQTSNSMPHALPLVCCTIPPRCFVYRASLPSAYPLLVDTYQSTPATVHCRSGMGRLSFRASLASEERTDLRQAFRAHSTPLLQGIGARRTLHNGL
jgi:hypothetical protein